MHSMLKSAAPAAALLVMATTTDVMAQVSTQERPISLDQPRMVAQAFSQLEISGFAIGSINWNSQIQMVPEFAGGAPAQSDPRQVNFRFDKFGLAFSKRFGPTLSVMAAVEVESHRDLHTHLRNNPVTQCVGTPVPCESFGAEEATTEATLDKLAITWMPWGGSGVGFAFGRFDVPFGIERHDEVLLMTATKSDIYLFAKPQMYTGLQTFYQLGPRVDLNFWIANRWESETTHTTFDDNNKAKSLGGRIGFSPAVRDGLLNFGIGGWYGAEQDNLDGPKRTLIDLDATWSPSSRTAYVAEAVWGSEDDVSFRERGFPFAAPAADNIKAKWVGGMVMAHQEMNRWFALTGRYGYLDDQNAWRTGVEQKLQSITLVGTVHLSALAGKAPLLVTYPRTQVRIHDVDLKMEYRYNKSNVTVFSDAPSPLAPTDAKTSSQQVQLQFAVNF